MTKSQWYIDHALVAIPLDHVSGVSEHGPTSPTLQGVRFPYSAKARINVVFEIVGDFVPDSFAVHCHGSVPFAKCSLVRQDPPSPGANRSRSMSRALSSRVFTDAVEIPSAFALSSMLKCCMSRGTNTSRCCSHKPRRLTVHQSGSDESWRRR
jgi:hypothetical protein